MQQKKKYDQNFDLLFEKFNERIYSGFKGEWRLKLLQEDLAGLYATGPMKIWDAGCGMGQLALWFARNSHTLSCCDISAKMLDVCRKNFGEAGAEGLFANIPAQEMAALIAPQDLVLFHAVIEWTADPLETLAIVASRVKAGGYLSLLFFNYHSFVYRNAVRGEWRIPFVGNEANWYGKGKKLTPPHPQKPHEMRHWLGEHGYDIEVQTGIRVFHDYMSETALGGSDMEELEALEYRYCREEPYRDMGRYVHILARKRVG